MKAVDLLDLEKTLQMECRLAPGSRVVVGVSGGADSLCLLDCLRRLDIQLLVAHFDHQLRSESAQDARRVAEMAQSLGVACRLGCGDVRGLANSASLSLEEAARQARYQFLFDQARAWSASAVAVAHTADDQVETVLMHLLRGAGLSGLKGMDLYTRPCEWDAQIALVRPLLNHWKVETEAWCTQHQLYPLQDPSNLDTTFFRNRLRHELIPLLQGYNPNVKTVLWRMARVLAGDWEVLAAQTELAWKTCWMEDGEDWVVLSLAALQNLPLGLQRAVLRRGVNRLRPGLRDIDFDLTERALEWLRQPPNGRWLSLAAGLWLQVEWGRVILSERRGLPPLSEWPQVAPEAELILTVPGEVALAGGWRLRAHWRLEDELFEPGYFAAGDGVGRLELGVELDGAAVNGALSPLLVRGARPGERLIPLGMDSHSQKLSDFFINRKLPQRARPNWPLVLWAGQVVWAAGLRLGEPFKVNQNTRQVLCLELVRAAPLAGEAVPPAG
jgi:tRNA(Ile)-lysidine synthase